MLTIPPHWWENFAWYVACLGFSATLVGVERPHALRVGVALQTGAGFRRIALCGVNG